MMPGPRSQASQGGTSPVTDLIKLESNHDDIMRLETEDNKKRTKLRQATLRWFPGDRGRGEDKERDRSKDRERGEEMQRDRGKEDKATWVQGGKEDDNKRYRDFLKYCEERREERKRELERDKSRKEEAKSKEDHWKLLRVCIETIKETHIKWTTRKIEECARIKEEEKRDRLAIV